MLFKINLDTYTLFTCYKISEVDLRKKSITNKLINVRDKYCKVLVVSAVIRSSNYAPRGLYLFGDDFFFGEYR